MAENISKISKQIFQYRISSQSNFLFHQIL